MNASGAGRHGWAPMNSANLYGGGDGGVRNCFPIDAPGMGRFKKFDLVGYS